MAWQDEMVPASFRGARFHVEQNATTGGRRGVTFEFPKRETPLDEDMGRRAIRRSVTGFTIGPDYAAEADELEAKLKQPGPGILTLPILPALRCRCDSYVRSEHKDRLGMAVFEMTFVEAPSAQAAGRTPDTQQGVKDAAAAAADAAMLSAGDDSDWI